MAASPAILVVMGASGAGKTAAVQTLEARARSGVRCFYFDSIGIPSPDVMLREFGGPEGWQLDATKRWISRLVSSADGETVSVLEGQTRPSFVRAAFTEVDALLRMVLLDCSSDVRAARLAARGQPDLATQRMDNWAAYLRGQADALEMPVVHTDALTIEEVVNALEVQVEAARTARREASQRGR